MAGGVRTPIINYNYGKINGMDLPEPHFMMFFEPQWEAIDVYYLNLYLYLNY